MNKTYKVQNILEEMKKYENNEIIIKSKNKEFYVKLFKNFSPHLLGVQYIDTENKYKGFRLFQFIKKHHLSDQEILKKVEENHGENQRINVENRINTFLNFMKNLEKGIIVEKTLETGMSVNYLIIQNKEDKIMHLGIMSCDNGALLNSYEELSKAEKDFFKTYFIEQNDRYFNNSKIFEKIKSIQIYDENLDEYLPFSFDEEKNKYLMDNWSKNKDGFDYIKTIENYYLDKENLCKIEKQKNIDDEMER